MAKNYCQHCGAKLSPSAKFCKNCGGAVSASGVPTSVKSNQRGLPTLASARSSSKRDRRGIMLLGMFLLFVGVAALLFSVLQYQLAVSPEPLFPAGVPKNVALSSSVGGDEQQISTDAHSFIVPYNLNNTININFDDESSIGGHWTGSGSFSITNESIPVRSHTDSWGSEISDVPTDQFTPWSQATFTLPTNTSHQWLNATALLDIRYPVRSSTPGYFTNASASMNRTVDFYPVSPQDYQAVSTYQTWSETHTNTSFWIVLGIIGSAFIGLGGYCVYTDMRRPR